jgi:hypothetical protein
LACWRFSDGSDQRVTGSKIDGKGDVRHSIDRLI